MSIPDISHYNETIYWDKLAEQAPFVIMRATVGINRDRRYVEFTDECRKRNMIFHAYHYLKALNEDEAVREAGVFHCATVGREPLYYIIDCEYDAISDATEKQPGLARTVVDAFEAELRRLAGEDIRVACYIGGNNYERWDLDYDKYAYLWIPRYGPDDGRPHDPPKFACDMWQYTSNGRVDYVSDDTDLNMLMGRKPLEFFTDEMDLQMGERDLQHGCVGADVKEVQQFLHNMGYQLGEHGTDGEFGPDTAHAVKAFRKEHGMAEHEVCDEYFYIMAKHYMQANDKKEEEV